MSEPQRRLTDPAEIEKMIAAEPDPKDRAILLILNNINNALVASTDTIRDVGTKLDAHITKFEQHTEAEEAMLNKGRGAWKVIAWAYGIVQAVAVAAFIYIGKDYRTELADIHAAVHANEVEHAVMKKQIEELESVQQ